jgi:hypothetical protein
MENALVALATRMGLSVFGAVALPAAVTVAAGKVGLSEADFVGRMERSAELRAYVAAACEKAVRS